MAIFHFTFMSKQAFHKRYVTINAANERQARDAMHDHFGDKWFTSYPEEGFGKQIIDFGLSELVTITVINHGSKEHPSIEYKLTG